MKVKRISEGAEAEIYAADILGIRAVAKYRAPKAYRAAQLDSAIRLQRTRNEARIMSVASSAGASVPGLLLVTSDKIFMRRVAGRTLNKMIRNARVSRRPKAALGWAGAQLAVLHKSGIAHGDYTPANIMVGERGDMHVIDFGLSEATRSTEELALDVLLMKRSIAPALYRIFVSRYASGYAGAKPVLKRLAEIERRGRYQARTLTAQG